MKQLKVGREDEELKECTFKPQTRRPQTGTVDKRSKDEFLKSQQKFIKEKEEKIVKAK